jgi:hypothetical protein
VSRNAPVAAELPPARPRNYKRATRPQFLTRDMLDGRTNAAKAFDAIVRAIEADLGGADQLSAIERALVEGFAGATVSLQNINTRLALGEAIDLSDQAQAISAMVRVASRLGEARRARAVNGVVAPSHAPTRADLLEQEAT